MKRLPAGLILTVLLAGCDTQPWWEPAPKPPELPLAYQTTFDQVDPAAWKAIDGKTPDPFPADIVKDPRGAKNMAWRMQQWWATDSRAWKVVRQGKEGYLSLYRQSEFAPAMLEPGKKLGEPQKPPVPMVAPQNYVLLPEVMVTSFQLDLMVRSTSPESPRRDLVIVFGYQSRIAYYYAHLCDQPGDSSHGIYVVDGDHRRPITKQRNAGIVWGTGWHHVRVVRPWRGGGAIMVYFDDMSAPVMTAADLRFDLGRVGVGSFNDLGDFDSITLKAIAREADGMAKDAPPAGKGAAPAGKGTPDQNE